MWLACDCFFFCLFFYMITGKKSLKMTELLICGRTPNISNTPSHKYLKVPKVE